MTSEETEEMERIVEDLKYIRKQIIATDLVEALIVLDALIDSIETPLEMKKELSPSDQTVDSSNK